jgi:hypothetical protein
MFVGDWFGRTPQAQVDTGKEPDATTDEKSDGEAQRNENCSPGERAPAGRVLVECRNQASTRLMNGG